MKFNLNNYQNFDKFITKYQKEKDQRLVLNKNQKINISLSLPQIINELNNSNLLNIPNGEEVNIVFENFSWFGKIKTILKNFISRTVYEENFESSVAHYDNQTKSIHIFNGIFEPKLNNNIFKKNYSMI